MASIVMESLEPQTSESPLSLVSHGSFSHDNSNYYMFKFISSCASYTTCLYHDFIVFALYLCRRQGDLKVSDLSFSGASLFTPDLKSWSDYVALKTCNSLLLPVAIPKLHLTECIPRDVPIKKALWFASQCLHV